MKKKKVKKIKPLGNLMLKMEPILLEMVDSHDLQHGDVYGLIRQYMEIHLPNHVEEFTDGTRPVFYYGHRDGLK